MNLCFDLRGGISMTKVILTIFAIIVPAFLGFILAYQIYKKKTATYMPLKNEFVHWAK